LRRWGRFGLLYPCIMFVYFGTGGTKLWMADMDSQSGNITNVRAACDASKPGFLALHPTLPFLYTVEKSRAEGTEDHVSAYLIDTTSGMLSFINSQLSCGSNPTHLAVDPSGKSLLVAKYDGGSVTSFPIDAEGAILPAATTHIHKGSSTDPIRQTKPYVHGVCCLGDEARTVAVCDLGTDKIHLYELDGETSSLIVPSPSTTSQQWLDALPGSGPRHAVAHPNTEWLYVCMEMGNAVEFYGRGGSCSDSNGRWVRKQSISTLPPTEGGISLDGSRKVAEILLHPAGLHLYVSNRGYDSVAVYSIHPESGMLTLEGIPTLPSSVQEPRGMGLDSRGRFLLLCGQISNNVGVWTLDPGTGLPSSEGDMLIIPVPDAPRCVVTMEAASER